MLNGKGSTKKSNLEGFFHCTTPLVPPQSLPKGEIRSLNGLWHPWEREKVEFFRLSDMWDCYDEWSAYGASVPVHLTNGDSLVQYYVPFLSAIQIFTSPSSLLRLSWMSVAWYPIYHIPMGRTIKDLSTCFLTYHTLSSSFQDMDPEENGGHKDRMRKEGEHITLSPFGMATHKMQGNVWLSHDQDDQERLVSLFSVADSWLKQLRVQHHDFNYFCTMSMTYHA
ncbi:hypothetical protein DY000_02028657 [Brassica cretica]|uniref:Uncharacterized protein n=1 Tax=Brassica cretica TaxID=69181 RepID=A0ABQ7DVS5_BRACR|nr:hypothetical protein DY000_02028657 [Brassica cretica]